MVGKRAYPEQGGEARPEERRVTGPRLRRHLVTGAGQRLLGN